MFRDPDAVAAQLTEYAGLLRLEDSFLSRIKRVSPTPSKTFDSPTASSTVPADRGGQGLAASGPAQPAGSSGGRLHPERRQQGAGREGAGWPDRCVWIQESAQAVLDYYQQQNRADVRFDPNEMLTEVALPSATVLRPRPTSSLTPRPCGRTAPSPAR